MEVKYIEFDELDNSPRKTKLWNVLSHEDDVLGFIQYETHWRRYAFHPNDCTYYEQDCLQKITDFCKEQTGKLRKTWKKRVQQ